MAANKKKATRKTHAAVLEPTPRHLWLASLGMLVAARRESRAAVGRASVALGNRAADARYALRRAEADLRAGVDGVRSHVEPKMQQFSHDVEAKLAPIVAKLGLKPKAPRKTRKTASKPVRRSVRKPAKRVAKKAAG